ncbi:MAG: hypothetical protein GY714_09785 [Desulfobacterales bacterium]|nr:hypothetical protein [Desulfobacterales bacterium]MCP4161520.1 hypothetical protein [Deltaproteobacteria bacterium]
MREKKIPIITLLIICFFVSITYCEDVVDYKKQSEEKCREVVEMIKKFGAILTFKELNKKKGRFVWEDSYVYTIDIKKGIILSHNDRSFVGKLVSDIKNINGRKIYREFMKMGETKGSGWISYIWKENRRRKHELKYSFVMKIPGQDILVISSTYDKQKPAPKKAKN